MSSHFRRVVVTGGPGAGKTTAVDLFGRELGDRVAVVPEAATMVYSGGFCRPKEPGTARAIQRAIYHIQRNLEEHFADLYPEKVILCDRGTLDGSIYWPDPPETFFAHLQTDVHREMERYHAVIFFETAAAGGIDIIDEGNPIRRDSLEEAVRLDSALRGAWSKHPRFILVPHQARFKTKLELGLEAMRETIRGIAK